MKKSQGWDYHALLSQFDKWTAMSAKFDNVKSMGAASARVLHHLLNHLRLAPIQKMFRLEMDSVKKINK